MHSVCIARIILNNGLIKDPRYMAVQSHDASGRIFVFSYLSGSWNNSWHVVVP